MNVFDALLLLPALALSLALLLSPVRTEPRQVSPRWRAWSWPAAPVPKAPLLTALLLTGLLFHLTLGVPRWQLAPAYLAAGLAMGLVVGLALGLLQVLRSEKRAGRAIQHYVCPSCGWKLSCRYSSTLTSAAGRK